MDILWKCGKTPRANTSERQARDLFWNAVECCRILKTFCRLQGQRKPSPIGNVDSIFTRLEGLPVEAGLVCARRPGATNYWCEGALIIQQSVNMRRYRFLFLLHGKAREATLIITVPFVLAFGPWLSIALEEQLADPL